MFNFEPSNVTREMLLNAHSEEEYFSFYGIQPTKGIFRSTFRSDRNPTCSFYKDKRGILRFRDFGTGDHWDFIQLVMNRFNVNYPKALKIIANDVGLIHKEKYTKNYPVLKYNNEKIEDNGPAIIQCEIKPFSEEDLLWWGKFGITQKTLNFFKVYSIKHVFLNGRLFSSASSTNPIYGYYFGKKDGLERWKIYFPLRKKFRFLLNCSDTQGLAKLPENGEYLVVTKSYKDVMTLYELGIPAIAPQGESIIINEAIYDKISSRFNTIIFNGDWDNAGKNFMIKSTLKYRSVALSIKNKVKYGKDISDLVSIYGIEKTRTLINIIKDRFEKGYYNHHLSRWQKKKESH